MGSVDWGFIKKFELTVPFGYTIPGKSGDQSGVTVASGFDLGQHTWSQIKDWPISPELKEKLRPYLGLSGTAARNLLYVTPPDDAFDPRLPLSSQIVPPRTTKVTDKRQTATVKTRVSGGLELSAKEVTELDKVVQEKKLSSIRRQYDAAAARCQRGHFDSLPGPIQTAIVSFCFQYGENIGQKPAGDRRRRYWDALVAQDWSAAIDTLFQRFFADSERAFWARRWDEITLLRYGMGDSRLDPELQRRMLGRGREA